MRITVRLNVVANQINRAPKRSGKRSEFLNVVFK